MRLVLDKLITALNLGQSAVLCTIVRSSGSAPRISRARMVVHSDGAMAGSVGMIGSRRKRTAVYEWLLQLGLTDLDLARVHCPIGLAIDADTPEEIAVSLVAEMVQARAKMAT